MMLTERKEESHTHKDRQPERQSDRKVGRRSCREKETWRGRQEDREVERIIQTK